MWAIDGATIVEFNTASIATGTVTPIHQFSVSDPNYPLINGMAFDRSGNLWVAEGNLNISMATSNYTGRVLEFTENQLANLGSIPSPVPAVTVTFAGAGFGVAFDASGDLWASVTNFNNGGGVQEFTPGQIASSGSPAPGVTIVVTQTPGGLVFGTDGTLWFTPTDLFGPSGGSINGFSPSQLTASGSQSPAYTLQGNAPQPVLAGQLAVMETPNEVTFDTLGDLWSIFNGSAFTYAPSALHGAGTTPTSAFQAYPGQQTGGQTEVLPGYAIAFDSADDTITNVIANTNTASNVLQFYAPNSTTPQQAHFSSSVPALDGTHLGNYLVSGPYVP